MMYCKESAISRGLTVGMMSLQKPLPQLDFCSRTFRPSSCPLGDLYLCGVCVEGHEASLNTINVSGHILPIVQGV